MEEEKVYTIPLREARKTQRDNRAAKAVDIVKEFLKKHLKVDEVKINPDLNQKIWEKGIENPPSRIRVRAIKQTPDMAEAASLE